MKQKNDMTMIGGMIFFMMGLIVLALLLASATALFSGCSDEVIHQEPQNDFIIIPRIDSTCPMKMRCVNYDTLYYEFDTLHITGM
jgi:hypothetical protein